MKIDIQKKRKFPNNFVGMMLNRAILWAEIKILLSAIIGASLLLISSCGEPNTETNDQLNNSDKQIKSMLLEFYSQNFQLWEAPSMPYDVLHKKLDSLMKEYCTSNLRNEAKEAFYNSGVDIVTGNLGSVDLNENLAVEKAQGLENTYLVSFLATYKDSPGGPIKKQVVLSVRVVKEDGDYKIASVNVK